MACLRIPRHSNQNKIATDNGQNQQHQQHPKKYGDVPFRFSSLGFLFFRIHEFGPGFSFGRYDHCGQENGGNQGYEKKGKPVNFPKHRTYGVKPDTPGPRGQKNNQKKSSTFRHGPRLPKTPANTAVKRTANTRAIIRCMKNIWFPPFAFASRLDGGVTVSLTKNFSLLKDRQQYGLSCI